jgi:UDP-N-acetylmuramyl pentapeptide phosphotransferase/UDP-N-acetylglucosamine-1-phosphate transferase
MNALTPDRAAIIVLLAAALLSAALIVLLLPLLQRYALAKPNARSSHVVPTPQGAGVAVIGATLAIAAIAAVLTGLAVPIAPFAATLFIALVGLIDDLRPIPVLPRLLLQAAAVGAIVFLAPAELRVAPACPLYIERALLLVAGLWFVNLVNFMDGLDLMTAAEAAPMTAAMILLFWLGEFQPLPALVAAALCGAVIGFAPFNRPVAKVFLGDVGSLPIGLLLGWCLLQLAWHGQLIAALLLPLYYLADATLTLFRRIVRGEPFWIAHRTHFYQRATDNGFTTPQVTGDVFLLNLALAALAIASTRVNALVGCALLALGALFVAVVLYRFGRGKRP